ncbi:uncharacterized protein LOC133365514 [Rhineura floridana]|uniref:uncharacterized protein LOC133365514 n=1 Tax=Rhineura floridana TaxID=261503 RepID=UPI002AC81942|nr:uncharacterized protein LOC133365514 [Rhineura floridana]
MASRRPMRRRPRYRVKARRRHTVRKRTMRSVKRYRRQKPPVRRIGSKLPKRLRTRKIRMTRDAWGMLHSFVDGIYRKVSGEAECLRRKDRRPSIISSDVQSALRQVMPTKYTRRIAYSKTR